MVLEFWFGKSCADLKTISERNKIWFSTDEMFDKIIRNRFSALIERANGNELNSWELYPHGSLALIIVLDQFPRNIYRGKPRAYAYDERALSLCKKGVASCTDRKLGIIERTFFYMPLEHAENIDAQNMSVSCFEQLHSEAPEEIKPITEEAVQHAIAHRDIIQRFGRFPHRNPAMNRVSTRAEREWLVVNPSTYGQN